MGPVSNSRSYCVEGGHANQKAMASLYIFCSIYIAIVIITLNKLKQFLIL